MVMPIDAINSFQRTVMVMQYFITAIMVRSLLFQQLSVKPHFHSGGEEFLY